jgi:hypothetical protein
MGNIGDSISTLVPAIGDAETAASQKVVDLLTEIKTRLTSKVDQSEILLSAALSMSTYGLEDAGYVEMLTRASKPSATGTVYTKTVSSVVELFYQDSAGVETQITTGGALNGAAIGGGITGAGYGSGGVALNWNSAGSNYQFKSGSGADAYAAITVDGLQLRDGSSHKVQLEAPAMSADYTLTFPNAVPATSALLTASTGGALGYTTAPAATSFLLVNSSGVVSYATTKQVAQTNNIVGGTATWSGPSISVTAGNDVYLDLRGAEIGDTLTSVSFRYATANTATIYADRMRDDAAANLETDTLATTGGTGTFATQVVSLATPHVYTVGDRVLIRLTAVTSTLVIAGWTATFTRGSAS